MATATTAAGVALDYPASVTYAQGPLDRSRLTTFFRFLLAIPNLIIMYVYFIGFEITTFIAWVAILFTGKYPDGLYSFGVGVMRMIANSLAYLHVMTDEYPPWSGTDAKAMSYPVQYSVSYSGSSNRVTVFFRFILAIPALIYAIVIVIGMYIVAFIAWWAIMITGRFPESMLSFCQGALRTIMRTYSYYFFLTDVYPPFSTS